jgi:hypothetical protein
LSKKEQEIFGSENERIQGNEEYILLPNDGLRIAPMKNSVAERIWREDEKYGKMAGMRSMTSFSITRDFRYLANRPFSGRLFFEENSIFTSGAFRN